MNANTSASAQRSMTTAYLLWFFLGGFGAHRMYMGRMGSGFGMLGLFVGSVIGTLFVVGLLGFAALSVWWIVDAFMIAKWCKSPRGGVQWERAGAVEASEPPMSNAA